MALVIGRGMEFYEIPDEVLEKYVIPVERVEKMKKNLKRSRGKEDAEVEGYGYYYGSTYEGYGWYCDWWDAWSQE